MAINLSDLTGASTSADILAEVQSTADFLDSVPLLKNLADPSGATDAKQFTATNQPTALPLTKDADGVLGGYCYLPNVLGNAPAVTFPTIGANDDFVLEMEVYLVDVDFFHLVSGSSTSNRIIVFNNGANFQFNLNSVNQGTLTSPINAGASTITCERANGTFFLKQDGVTKGTIANASGNGDFSHLSFNGQFGPTSIPPLNGYIKTATLSIEGTEELNIDFTAPNVRHGATKFKCATGQVVTINQFGEDPATVIKKPVLRFDGVNDFMDGVFNQTITDGYMFAAFSVLGGGGETYGRVFSVNPTGVIDSASSAFIYSLRHDDTSPVALGYYYGGTYSPSHLGLFDDANGDILHEVKSVDGAQFSKVNNADNITTSFDLSAVASQEFSISNYRNAALDLEYLALFPASITDEQADAVRNYINNRNNVFDLKDGFGYYFFDPQSLTTGAVTSWNGRIIGSDNGDVDKLATQATAADQPTSDGYKVTFADATDHLEIPSTTQAGWQVVGTSLGTFVYKVDSDAVTELNLLGNLGNATYRQAGDLYGVILLPENATNRDINEARQLLIDRGAADGTTPTSLSNFWRNRADIVEFKHINTSSVTSYFRAWRGCSALTSFPLLDHNNAVDFREAFLDNDSLQSFPAIQAPNCVNFSNAWAGCSALTSFPADAKLGTEATNVNFASAWQSSGLTSFSTPLPTATNVGEAWRGCNSLASFNSDLSLVINASYAWRGCTPLTSFSTELPLATNVFSAWHSCTSLTSFDTEIPSANNLGYSWYNCASLTDFSADVFANWNPSSISSGVFTLTWDNCSSLTAQSVENILTSIAASGKYATSTGASGGTALADATIDIDYNVSTGSLTAATLTAIETLNGRGWSVNINGVIQ